MLIVRFLGVLSFALVSSSAIAQSVNSDRQMNALPWIAHDRDQAMNDKALCLGDLTSVNAKIAEIQSKLDAANKKIDELKDAKSVSP